MRYVLSSKTLQHLPPFAMTLHKIEERVRLAQQRIAARQGNHIADGETWSEWAHRGGARPLVVVACYLLSSFGLLLAIGISSNWGHPDRSSFDIAAAIFWPVALLVHLLMSATWIMGKRLGASWVVFGVCAGVASFAILEHLDLVFAGLVFMAPNMLLTIWLAKFHWQTNTVA
jgi:hypothetical protein